MIRGAHFSMAIVDPVTQAVYPTEKVGNVRRVILPAGTSYHIYLANDSTVPLMPSIAVGGRTALAPHPDAVLHPGDQYVVTGWLASRGSFIQPFGAGYFPGSTRKAAWACESFEWDVNIRMTNAECNITEYQLIRVTPKSDSLVQIKRARRIGAPHQVTT
jgi:hypothetical protein